MNKIVRQKANPEQEFSDDLMMKNLHKVQIRITQQIKNMDGKEISKFFKKKLK